MQTYRKSLQQKAAELLSRAVVFDTETTGLGPTDTIVEITAVAAKNRKVLIDTLVVPNSPMCGPAYAVHGIKVTDAMSQGVSVAAAVSNLLSDALKELERPSLVAFNLPFDMRLVTQSLYLETNQTTGSYHTRARWADASEGHEEGRFSPPACVMELANRYFSDQLVWDAERSSFKRLSLERCLELAGIQREGKAHRALSDTLATVDLLRFIAGEAA